MRVTGPDGSVLARSQRVAPYERRLQRYAFLTLPLTGIVVLVLAGALPTSAGVLAILFASLPLLWAWGPYQGHLALNGALDGIEKNRWRIAFYLVPPSMALYWLLHIRGRSAID